MLFLAHEEDILERMIWGNPNIWTVALETAVSREWAAAGLSTVIPGRLLVLFSFSITSRKL